MVGLIREYIAVVIDIVGIQQRLALCPSAIISTLMLMLSYFTFVLGSLAP
jgi:hypothetical protein